MLIELPVAPIPESGFLITHFLTVEDLPRSSDFYARILGGDIIVSGMPTIIKLSNSWIILNKGGGPTPDKPEVFLESPQDLGKVNSFLNLRVSDIRESYQKWKARGAQFLTEPLDNHGWEIRCYMRDPDGYLIEVGQPRQKMIDLMNQGN